MNPFSVTVSLASLVALCGCSNELQGTLTVDEAAFVMDSCRSGQVYGFSGVEVTSKTGARLRISRTPGGEATVFYLAAGQSIGAPMGACGSLAMTTQNSTINDVRNVEGKALLDCNNGEHAVQGEFSFSNCH